MELLPLIVSAIGLIGLSVLLLVSDPPEVTVNNFQDTTLEDVRITGQILNIREYDKLSVMEIGQIQKVDVVLFDKRLAKEIGSNVTIDGQVREYRGKKELIAHEVKLRPTANKAK